MDYFPHLFSLLIRDGKSAQELRFATGHFLSGCLGPFHMQPCYLPPWICTENATREAQCPIQGRDSGTWNLATAHVSFKEHGKSPHVIGSYKNIIEYIRSIGSHKKWLSFLMFYGYQKYRDPNLDIQQVDVVEEVDLSEIMAIMRSPEKLEEARSHWPCGDYFNWW